MQKQTFRTLCDKSIQKLMQKRYIKGTHVRFSTSYPNVVIQIYCPFKIGKIVSQKSFVIFTFLQLGFIRETYSKYYQNRLKNQLPEVLFCEFYIHSIYVINRCI